MWKNVNYSLRAFFAFLLVIAVPSVGMSQSIWLPPSGRSSVSLEVLKADWAGNNNITFVSSVWFMTGRYKTSSSLTIAGELPLSHIDFGSSGAFSPEASTAIGNPYLGITFNPENSFFIGEAGVRVPIISAGAGDALVNGWVSEFDRWEAFIPDLLTVRVRLGGNINSNSKIFRARFLGGGTLWIPTESGSHEVFADAIGQFWFQESKFTFGTTLSARTLLTGPSGDFIERSEFQLGFSANGTFGNVRPGFHFHIPLADEGLLGVGQVVDAVFGINITLFFGLPGNNG